MRIAKLFIPGRFENAYVYRGRLLVITENKTLLAYSLEKFAEGLEAAYPEIMAIPTYMLLQNDWFDSSQFKSLIRNREIAQAFLGAFNRFESRCSDFEVRKEYPNLKQENLKIRSSLVTDLILYNDRMYVATDDGLHSFDIEWSENGGTALGDSSTYKLNFECIHISVKYGSVNAACTENGLLTFFDDFRWREKERRSPKQKEVFSLKTAWTGYNFVNYSSYDSGSVFNTSRVLLGQDRRIVEREQRLLLDIRGEGKSLLDYTDFTNPSQNIQRSAVQYVYNFNDSVFIQTIDEEFYLLQLHHDKRHEIKEIDNDPIQRGTSKRILSVSDCKVGILIETLEEVLLIPFRQNEPISLFEGEVMSVKTFPNSKQFQNLVAITLEDGILLYSLFDETELVKSIESNG